MIAHSWKFSNDYLAALLYLEGCRTVSAIDAFCRSNWIDLNARGMGLGSMAMRVKNIEAIGSLANTQVPTLQLTPPTKWLRLFVGVRFGNSLPKK